jgi:uncharacterized protein YkwD
MRRQGTVVLLTAAFALAMLAGGPSAVAADRCTGQDDPVSSATKLKAERVLLCLVNLHRAANDLAPVAHDLSLRMAARAHSEDMVAKDYFNHYSPPNAEGPHERAVKHGYPASGDVGENLVLDPNATPLSLFEGLVGSQPHNVTMLDPQWVTAGMGLALGTPTPMRGTTGATGTQMFGTADTDAKDTAIELLVTDECRRARHDRSVAARAVRRARHELQQADTPSAEEAARAKLEQALRRLERVKRRQQKACNPASFPS